MKHVFSIITLLTLFYGSSCKQTAQSDVDLEQSISEDEVIEQEIQLHRNNWTDVIPYTMEQQLIQESENQFKLDITLDPIEGSYIFSRFSVQDFMGKFTIELEENSYFTQNGELIESPESGTIFEVFSGTYEKAIREKTTCTQSYKVSSKEDFQVKGKVYFVIEPKCTLEEHPFEIIQTSGRISLKMLETK